MGLALLYPAPEGPVATERYEMFREGVELCEALLFIERAVQQEELRPELRQQAVTCLEERGRAFIEKWFILGDRLAPDADARLLEMAGEVARELEKK